MKICSKYLQEKDLDLFKNDNNTKDGKKCWCLLCTKEYNKLRNQKNKEKNILYYNNNKERYKKYVNNYYNNNKEKHNERNKKYYKNNKEIINFNKSIYSKLKYNTDINFRTNSIIRNLINGSFKRSLEEIYIKSKKTEDILGCTLGEFKIHLENKFEPWMTWNNQGLYNGELNYGWDIDHIIPISSAKTEEDIYKLNHFSNLQPLCSKVNRDIKRDRL